MNNVIEVVVRLKELIGQSTFVVWNGVKEVQLTWSKAPSLLISCTISYATCDRRLGSRDLIIASPFCEDLAVTTTKNLGRRQNTFSRTGNRICYGH